MLIISCFTLLNVKIIYGTTPGKTEIFAAVSAVSTRFSEELKKTVLKDEVITHDEETALSRIAAWMSDNRCPCFKDFVEILAIEDVKTILDSALYSELTSTEFIPIMEKQEESDQKTVLTFPFNEEWFVMQGNDGVISHKEENGSKYAWDFVILINGIMGTGNLGKNKNYFSWGKEVLAPADGVVVRMENEMADHPPMTTKMGAANFVWIDHGNGEVSKIYHLMKGSVKVRKGEEIKRGQVVGLVGDSGISMSPHIHYSLSKKSEDGLFNIPARFAGYFARKTDEKNYRLVLNGVPQEKEFVIGIPQYVELMKTEIMKK
ncbi:MAG: M23 family metallopeptidase [Spirochaetota bacterium]